MINSTDAENFETGGSDQSHLFQPPESVSGSESEGMSLSLHDVTNPNPTIRKTDDGEEHRRTGPSNSQRQP